MRIKSNLSDVPLWQIAIFTGGYELSKFTVGYCLKQFNKEKPQSNIDCGSIAPEHLKKKDAVVSR